MKILKILFIKIFNMYIIANWKMNPRTKKEAEEIIKKISEELLKIKLDLGIREGEQKIIICPPFLYLDLVKKFGSNRFFLGAQNLSSEKGGAFTPLEVIRARKNNKTERQFLTGLTGEISAQQLVDFGVDYVIIGHSERRNYFQETDKIINKKIKVALEYNLRVIFCIGESLVEKEKYITIDVLKEQIINGLEDIKLNKFQKDQIIIAYEPTWAIGTGIIPTYNEYNEILEIKNEIKRLLKGLNFNFPVIYGGSVDENNIQNFIKISKMDGVLVGSKSLDPKSFIEIIKNSASF